MSNLFENIFEYQNKHFTGNDVINYIEKMDPEKPVFFADTVEGFHDRQAFPVNDFFSWRGSYDKPSISSSGRKVYTGSELVEELNEFFSSVQTGWKGGEFAMDAYDELWCDAKGSYNEKGVSGVVECDEAIYIVIGQFKY